MAASGLAERDLVALPADLALVGPVRAGQDLDQRGLAGAVLAEQAVDLTRSDHQVDAVERPDARERLDDAAHLQQWQVGRLAHLVSSAAGRVTAVTRCWLETYGRKTKESKTISKVSFESVGTTQPAAYTASLISRAAPMTPASPPSSLSTTGMLPVASGSDCR